MSGFEPLIIGAMIAGTAVSAYGTYQSGQSQKRQARAQAAWHKYNAKLAKRDADAERSAANFASKQQKRKADALLSRQRAMIGKSGVEMEGSPLLVAEDTAEQLAIENMGVRLRGSRKAQQLENRAILDMSKASAAEMAAGDYGRAGVIGAGGSLLSGAGMTAYAGGKMYKKW